MTRSLACLITAIILLTIGLLIVCDWLIDGNAEAFLFAGLIALTASSIPWRK